MVKWRRMEGAERELSDGERKHVENPKSVFLYRWCVDIYRMDIYLMWLDCPLKFVSVVGLLQEVDMPSCTPRMHKNDLIQSESGLSCTFPSPLEVMFSFPSNCTQTPNPSFPYHAVFGPSQDEWFKGSQANVLVEACARSEHQNLRTAETWMDVGWCRGKDAKWCSWSKSWWKLKWEFSDCLCLVVLYMLFLGYDIYDSPLCPGSCLLVVKFTTLSWSSKSIFHSEAWIPSKQHGAVEICSLKTRNHPSHMNCSRTSHFS